MENTLLETFRQAYRDLELFPLLEAEQIEKFRVEYGNDTIARLEQVVEDSGEDAKTIFTGHTGCGKSTLLARFANRMRRKNYFVVLFSIADLVELSAVDHITILYAIALSLLVEATKKQVSITETTKQSLLDWFTTTRTTTSTKDTKSEFGVGVEVLKSLTAKLKNEATFREEIKKTYERSVTDLARKADEITAAIQVATKKQVLVIIDDLDKLDLGLVEAVYKNNINSLFLPRFQIIFTILISAIRNSELFAVLSTKTSDRIKLLAICKFFSQSNCRDSQAIPLEKPMNLFLEVLQKRIPAELIEPETARQIVLKSGGVVRELVRLARECCTQCLLLIRMEPDRQDIKINAEVLAAAVKDLRNDFARPLGEKLYQILAKTYTDLAPDDAKSDDFLSLLHGLWVLEYENDDLWYDVHPIVVDLLKRKKLIT